MRWLSRIKLADLFTLMNGVFGFLSMTYTVDRRFLAASLLICAGMVMDGLDGYFARRAGLQRDIGRYLDSVSDSVTFCLAPAILLYGVFYDASLGTAWTSAQNFLVLVVASFYAICGFLRLARFTGKQFAEPRFFGMPTPAAAFGMILFCMLLGGSETAGLSFAYEPNIAIAGAFILALIMISDIPYPKIKGRTLLVPAAIVVCTAMAAVFLATFYWVYLVPLVAHALAWLALVFFLAYLLGGPIYETLKRRG